MAPVGRDGLKRAGDLLIRASRTRLAAGEMLRDGVETDARRLLELSAQWEREAAALMGWETK